MSKFIVTGSRGYVAGRLIRRLLANGHQVVGLTRGSGAGRAEPGFIEVTVADYTNEALLTRTVSGAQAIFHLASRAHQRITLEESGELFHSANVAPTIALARACALADVGRFVMVSSIGVLGTCTDGVAFSDASVTAPVEPYAVSKAVAEQRVIELLNDNDCSYCILRPPLVYGPECPGNFSSLIAFIANAMIVPLAGIRAPRTFIHIDHMVEALIVAAMHPAVSRRTFVISDDTHTSVSEIVQIAALIFGREPWRVVEIPETLLRTLSILAGRRAEFDKLLTSLCVDSTGFKDATGWRPARSTTEAIAATLREWQKIHIP